MIVFKESLQIPLSANEVQDVVHRAVDPSAWKGKRVLVIIPDNTRNAPIDLFFRVLNDVLGSRVAALDYLVALGTHPPMDREQMARRVGCVPSELDERFGHIRFFNHAWDDPEELTVIGTLGSDEIEEISKGLMSEEVPITLNRRVFDYDLLILVSPVVPHEVAGFSGGNKYLFPGIAGPAILHFFHWLAAVITNWEINGTIENPVRGVLDRAATFLQVPRVGLNMVVRDGQLCGLFAGDVEEGWRKAAELSARVHIRYKERPYSNVLGITPPYYDDLWVGGKVMYKLEPIIADGGELIIYAPHIREVSYTHGRLLMQIGYHVRDYFLSRMEHFSEVPRGILAHSTHVKGLGRYDDEVETPRVRVTLATGIAEEVCRQINLGYRNPGEIEVDRWAKEYESDGLIVQKAGGDLYRVRNTD